MDIVLERDLGKKPYRLHCQVLTDPYPPKESFEKARVRAAEGFIRDMKWQGWDFVDRFGFRMQGPKAHIEARTIPRRPRWPSGKELLAKLHRGEPIPDTYVSPIQDVPPLALSEVWEWDLSGVFVRDTLRFEIPSPAEEKAALRNR